MNLIKYITKIWDDQEGVAIIEMALMTPVLLLLSVSGYQAAERLLLDIKLERAAYSIADVASQNQSLTNAQINDIFEMAAQVI